jgi:prophage regulatory protein
MSGAPVDNRRSPEDFQTNRRHSSSRAMATKMLQSDTPVYPHGSETAGPVPEVVFMRLPEVKAVTGLSKTSIYELIRAKSFPAPVRLGPRAVAWVKAEIREWAAERVHASRSAA